MIDRHEGELVGRYRLLRCLGRGGMASVYLASIEGEHGFEGQVAIKLMHRHLAEREALVRMFVDEVRVASRVHHHNVCAVRDVGTHDGLPYLVMEYLRGVPLSTVLERARASSPRLPTALAVRIVADAARGLHAAHELRGKDGALLGVVHRDVSPQNVMVLFDGSVKVVDFGIATAHGRATHTESGDIKGKLAYLAPERLRASIDGSRVDRRVDVWALGVVLWEATLGRRLFPAGAVETTLTSVLGATIARPSEIDPDIPAELDDLVMRALAREPEHRLPTAAALADTLEQYLYDAGEPVGSAQVAQWMTAHFASEIATTRDLDARTLAPRGPPTRSRVARVALVAGAVTALAAAVWAGVPALSRREPEPARARSQPRTPLRAPRLVVAAPVTPPAVPAVEEIADAAPPIRRPPRAPPRRIHAPAASTPAPEPPPTATASTQTAAAAPAVATGKLNLMAIPAAVVTENGRVLGTTPLVERTMPAGVHRLTLRALEGSAERTVEVLVEPGTTVRRTVRLAGTSPSP